MSSDLAGRLRLYWSVDFGGTFPLVAINETMSYDNDTVVLLSD